MRRIAAYNSFRLRARTDAVERCGSEMSDILVDAVSVQQTRGASAAADAQYPGTGSESLQTVPPLTPVLRIPPQHPQHSLSPISRVRAQARASPPGSPAGLRPTEPSGPTRRLSPSPRLRPLRSPELRTTRPLIDLDDMDDLDDESVAFPTSEYESRYGDESDDVYADFGVIFGGALPTPPAQQETPQQTQVQRPATPPARTASPRPAAVARLKKKKTTLTTTDRPGLPGVMLIGGVPPINVLIVEDNIINLRLLEAFVKRLKVRWQTAMNGREAVDKWRAGGFHLVLMDIQLPVMSGLEATREIRRLERMNSIGAFSSPPTPAPKKVKEVNEVNEGDGSGDGDDEDEDGVGEKDVLKNRDMFKSPVIIVALTASSLQSDRHEALAAGCNDFLTKPVTYVWLERKVMEWGCMQALIDFDGWRKWKSYSQNAEVEDGSAAAMAAKKARAKKNRLSQTTSSSEAH